MKTKQTCFIYSSVGMLQESNRGRKESEVLHMKEQTLGLTLAGAVTLDGRYLQ